MKRGAKPLYSWDRWFTLKRFALRRGKHYHCSNSAMAGQVRNAASRRGLGVSVDEVYDKAGTLLLVTVRNPTQDMFGGEECAASLSRS